MRANRVFGFIVMMFFFAQAVNAQGTDEIKKYFNDAAVKVAAEEDPAIKREILANSFQTMFRALDGVEQSGLIPEENRADMNRFRAALQEKQDELDGVNGFAPVPDGQLTAFANYVAQDMEQAARTITISLVAALLIIIIIILLT